MKAFLKIYVCASEEGTLKNDKLLVTVQPHPRKKVQERYGPTWHFAKKCSEAIANIVDALTDEERIELREELKRLYISLEEDKT